MTRLHVLRILPSALPLIAVFGCGQPSVSNGGSPTPGTRIAGATFPTTERSQARPGPTATPSPLSSAPVASSSPGFPSAAPSAPLTPTTPYGGKTLSEWIGELDSKDAVTRGRAVDAVSRYGPDAKDAIPSLVKVLNDPRDPTFPSALAALAAFGPASGAAVPRLTELLKHDQVEIRRSAAETLARLGPAAGRAVSALIDLLASDESGPEKPLRETAAVALGKVGKHDLRTVFDAFLAKRLPETLLGRVIESLGQADADAVDGLVRQLSRKDPRTLSHAANGLRRIGSAAWVAALPELRILLGSSEPSIRNCAHEVIEEIVPSGLKGVPPKGSILPKTSALFDIHDTLGKAGFDGRQEWGHHLANFVRFGTKVEADKYWAGDQFDRIEVERGTKDHRDKVYDKAYRIARLKFLPVVREDIEKVGLIAEVRLPMRVRGDDDGTYSGTLSKIHASEANTSDLYFLTKEGRLRACTFEDAEIVRRNNGVIYFPEVPNSTLILFFKGSLDTLNSKPCRILPSASRILFLAHPRTAYFSTDQNEEHAVS